MSIDIKELGKLIHDYNHDNFGVLIKTETTTFLYNSLMEHQMVKMDANGKIRKIVKENIYYGKIRIKKNYGFVETSKGDFFVKNIENYIDGDEVLVQKIDSDKSKKNDEAKIFELVKRNTKELLIFITRKNKPQIPNDNEYKFYKVKLKREKNYLKYVNTYVMIEIEKVENYTIYANIKSVVADRNDPDLDMKIVLAQFNIESDFTEQALTIASEVAKEKIVPTKDRVDLTKQMTFTIDGADAKDLDDAVSLIKEGEDYRLIVSIADVSYYLEEDSLLDEVARSRSTSVYFIDRVVPMLPKDISNGICSLHPNVNRYTLSCEMLINKKGQVIDQKIYPSIINSRYKMTYENVNKMLLENDTDLINEYSEIYGILKEMNKLSKILNKKRLTRGAFNFEDKEPSFILDDNNEIIDITVRKRHDAEKLIEEFMIVANETVAQMIEHMDLPFIYRVHGQPTENKLVELRQIFPLFGVLLKGNDEDFHSLSFIKALEEVEDPLEKRVLSDMIIRSLQKAYYSTNNIGHFGLASKGYTHFTSPIRRYPDLIVHRYLRKYLVSNNYDTTPQEFGKLTYMAEYASEKEIKAIKAEQLIEDQKKAKYMEQFISQEFVGVVASVVEFGFFVELENTMRGLIRFRQLKDFVEQKNFKIILKNKKTIKVGQKINVRLVGVNIQRGLVDFEPVDYAVAEKDKDFKRPYKGAKKSNPKAKRKQNTKRK